MGMMILYLMILSSFFGLGRPLPTGRLPSCLRQGTAFRNAWRSECRQRILSIRGQNSLTAIDMWRVFC